MEIHINGEIRLTENDLKRLEDTVAKGFYRGVVSAMRTLIKEGLLHSMVAETAAAAPAVAVAPMPAAAPEAPEPPALAPTQQPPELPAPHREKESITRRRSVRTVLRSVAKRPPGFMPVADAAELIDDMPHDKAVAIVNKWALEREVEAVIACDIRPPSKGLPGRVVVSRNSLEKRNRVRLENKALPPRLRKHKQFIQQEAA